MARIEGRNNNLMRNPYGFCKSCGQMVIWIKTQAAKNMPCNPEIITYRKQKGGKEKIVTINGEVYSGEIVEAGALDATGIGYISHFATCPNASKHRERK